MDLRSRSCLVLWLAVLGFFAAGCMGRSSSVRVLAPGDLRQIQAQAIGPLYFMPFDTRGVVLKGDHGDPPTAEQNKSKWFSHVLAGAQLAVDESQIRSAVVFVTPAINPYDAVVMDKLKVRFQYSPTVPPNTVVVVGRYLESDNVSGGARAFIGVMGGNTYTRAQIRVLRNNVVICDVTLDGNYLGGGFSWGYETLGANEALGRSIVEVIQKLQTGQRVEVESARADEPHPAGAGHHL